MGISKRDRVIQDFIKLPGVSPRVANQLYDMGFQSLKELSKAETNYLFRLGLNRQLASNIERIMDIWDDSGGDVDDAVAVFRGKKSRRRRGREDRSAPEETESWGDGGGSSARTWGLITVSGRQYKGGKSEVRSSEVLTDGGTVKKMQVCTVCKNLVTISNGECPYCRDNPVILPSDTMITEEDEDKQRRRRLKRKLRDVDRLIGNCDQDGIRTARAKKIYAKAVPAFEEDDLDTTEKMLKKTIAIIEMERLNRRRELEKKRRILSGEIDEDGNEIKWDLRNKGRLSLWRKWQAGLSSFVTPKSFQDKKYERRRGAAMAHYVKVLFWLGLITLAIVLFVLFIITVLIYFGFLNV